MQFKITDNGSEKQVALKGDFTFKESEKIREIIEQLQQKPARHVVVDFSEVEFIDSAGLGMLLLMRDGCEQQGVNVTLQDAQGQVARMFSLSKFDQLFAIT